MPLISRDKEQAEQLSTGTELAAQLTQRYLAIEAVYLENQSGEAIELLRNRVVLLYKCILEFQIRAVIQLGGNTARRTAHHMFSTSSWSDFSKQMKDADSGCEEQRQLLDAVHGRRNATVLLSLLQRFQSDLLDEWRSYRKKHEKWCATERASECMKALRTIDYEPYKNIVPVRAAGTCRWLTEHEKFRDWLKRDGFACLWTTANPRCGKSVLCRYLVDQYLPNHCENLTNVCY